MRGFATTSPVWGPHTKRSENRILTTHVGSLVRPQALLDAAAAAKDEAGHKKYLETLRACVAEVVKKQAAAGIDIVNDGEYGKSSWANYVFGRVTGFAARPGKFAPAVWLGRD
jgi:5-methyltetrahydropteroyltriglutamate--homocysteine methyltransferase